MNNLLNVRNFFEKLSTTVAADTTPSHQMLLRSKPSLTENSGGLQEMLVAALNQPRLIAVELNDFGVGLPPLAHD